MNAATGKGRSRRSGPSDLGLAFVALLLLLLLLALLLLLLLRALLHSFTFVALRLTPLTPASSLRRCVHTHSTCAWVVRLPRSLWRRRQPSSCPVPERPSPKKRQRSRKAFRNRGAPVQLPKMDLPLCATGKQGVHENRPSHSSDGAPDARARPSWKNVRGYPNRPDEPMDVAQSGQRPDMPTPIWNPHARDLPCAPQKDHDITPDTPRLARATPGTPKTNHDSTPGTPRLVRATARNTEAITTMTLARSYESPEGKGLVHTQWSQRFRTARRQPARNDQISSVRRTAAEFVSG